MLCEVGIQIYYFAYGYTGVSAPFVENTTHATLDSFYTLVEIKLS